MKLPILPGLLGRISFLLLAASLLAPTAPGQDVTQQLREQITQAWHEGKTLPIEIGKQFPPSLIRVKDDKGYNIMIDISHQCSFASLWGLGGRLHGMGFRSVSNQACLDTVLDPAGKCRVRIPFDTANKVFPFAWYPNFRYNVVITEQSDPNAQPYTDKEQQALVKFVQDGGSAVILANPSGDEGAMKAWSINALAGRFGGEFLAVRDKYNGKNYATLNLGDEWEVMAKGENGQPVQARRPFGKGKVVMLGNLDAIRHQGRNHEVNRQVDSFLVSMLDWACEGQKPVGGEPRFPQPMGGGGAIYPELSSNAGDIVVYYAGNQKPNLLKTIQETFPETTKKVIGWLPSRPTNEPMTLILSAGDGGGWAVNAFKPKENGVISDSAAGLISIYAHEFAHTLAGPPNDKDALGGRPPIPEQGEAHAGWFQGKADAWFDEARRDKPNRNCDQFFKNPKFMQLDMKKYTTNREFAKGFSNSEEWAKTWYIWQKLDDRYGTTWFPRWKWIQHVRWADDPARDLTWEEMVEDMSIAVGEDLFPFFIRIGTSLDRKTMGKVEFKGKIYELPEAPIEATEPGHVRLEDIGDYKKPIVLAK